MPTASQSTSQPGQADSRHGIILFDGVCNFCNSTVNFIIDHDPAGYFQFAALQSDFGQQALARFKLSTQDFDSVILIENNAYHTKSSAALRVARRLGSPWSLAYPLVMIPAGLRNRVYDFIAAHRYQWFGKQDQCRLPTPAIRSRFLDQTPINAP